MEFRNLTPFDALCYGAIDQADEEHRIVAIKVAYALQRVGDSWRAEVMDTQPAQLCTADIFWGEPGLSSVREESDLALHKPKCDVLINGATHAPHGRSAAHWSARMRISSLNTPAQPESEPIQPLPLNPYMPLSKDQLVKWERDVARVRQRNQDLAQPTRRVLLDKSLGISGPSEFNTTPIWGSWRRSASRPVNQVALRWEYAFGGSCVVRDSKNTDGPALLNEVCFSNPIGTGWAEQRWWKQLGKAKQSAPTQLAAPQIEYPQQALKEPVFAKHPEQALQAPQMTKVAQQYGTSPAGFGPLGRSWAPRLQQAGTYDDSWLKNRHPGLPLDFDFAYWNCAPADQQIPYLPSNTRIELWNLTHPTLTPTGHLSVDLPNHRAFVLMRLTNGAMLPLAMDTDTVLIDTEAMTISLTHRVLVPTGTPVRVLEARFEIDPLAPLLRLKPEALENHDRASELI